MYNIHGRNIQSKAFTQPFDSQTPLFFRGFVPFLYLADFVSRDKNLQVVDFTKAKIEIARLGNDNHQ